MQKAQVIPMKPDKKKQISAFIQENLAKGFICSSYSLQISVVFVIPKKDGGKQVITDYQHLNSRTIPSNYPLLSFKCSRVLGSD